ncbi:MAG: DUF3866 family protein [Actinomycetota bacterium]
MPVFREGKVVRVAEEQADLLAVRVALHSGEIDAVGFAHMLGPIGPGDRVVVNTTGIELGLGTGGVGFILWNLDAGPPTPEEGPGHIVKLRYTPWQMGVLAVEEAASEHHHALVDAESVGGMPVVACGLHSQVAGVVAGIKAAGADLSVGYVMTDGAALPLRWSRLVRGLVEARLVDVTATSGHAFGGDLETVNVFSALVALHEVARVDVAVVAMGPGIVGTGTRLGFTGMEQGQVLDAAAAVGGRPVACVRLSFADERPRHEGISHHSLTALRIAARERATVVMPKLDPARRDVTLRQLDDAGVCSRHEVVFADGRPGIELLRARGLRPTSMGRSIDDAPEPFLAAAAAGRVAAELVPG